MKFDQLVSIVSDEPVFETGLLLSGDMDPADVRRQLSRWVTSGKLLQLRRGVYALAAPFQRVKPHPFVVANRLVPGSYVSRQSALAYYGMIPEHVPTVTSVSSRRPGSFDTPLGRYDFRHVKPCLLFGFSSVEISRGQEALVATPEKALLDLVHLHPGGDSPPYLRELRLQNLHNLDLDELSRQAEVAGNPKLQRAVRTIAELANAETGEFDPL
jgi:predicted transcriptional regulator of viral defense system